MKFRVVLPQFRWRECLRDLAECLVDALRRDGHAAELVDEFRRGTEVEIVLGAHEPSVVLPDYPVVIYQTEVPASGWYTDGYKARLASALAVWEAAPGYVTQDASRTSVVEPGLIRVPGLGAGEVEALGKYFPKTKDIDILFYGSLSPRRIAILTKLQDAGLAPSVHFGLFGKNRDALIDRARIIVDIMQTDGEPGDATRTFFLDSRGACVLSENDKNPARVLAPWRIVEQCRELLADEGKRAAHAAARLSELRPMQTAHAVEQLAKIIGTKDSQRLRAVES